MRPDRSAELSALAPKSHRNAIIAASLAALVAIIAVASYFITTSGSGSDSLKMSSKYVADNGAGITPYADVKAKPGAKHVDIYEDFQCPSCGMLERNNAANLRHLAQAGKVTVTYHIMNFLDENMHNDSSTRAGSASVCAAKSGKFMAMHDIIYANQPKQEGTGYTNEQLYNFGKAANLSGDSDSCISGNKYAKWINKSNEVSLKAGADRTPTIKVNGTMMNDDTRGKLQVGQIDWATALNVK